MAVKDWSTVAASNASVGSINWTEGQAPSTVNNSARAEMADVKAWYDAILHNKASFATAGGSSSAYTLTPSTETTIAAYAHGQIFGFRANHSITGAATLNVNSVGAVAIQWRGAALVSGDINSGDTVLVIYESVTPAFQMISVPRISATGQAASTTASGIVELATNAEVNTGTDTVRAVVPASVAQIIVGATAETAPATGDSVLLYDLSATAQRSMTLANLLTIINGLTADTTPDIAADFIPTFDASASAAKKITIANIVTQVTPSQATMETATSTTTLCTPNTIKWNPGVAKAWATYEQIGTHSFLLSHNCTSIADGGVGISDITFTTAFSTADYSPSGMARNANPAADCTLSCIDGDTNTTTVCTFRSYDISSGAYDANKSYITVMGDQ